MGFKSNLKLSLKMENAFLRETKTNRFLLDLGNREWM